MASNTWEKRRKEKVRRERKEAKRAKRDEKRESTSEPVEEGPTNEELMAQFAALGREHAQGAIDDATFQVRRNEIWLALGLPED